MGQDFDVVDEALTEDDEIALPQQDDPGVVRDEHRLVVDLDAGLRGAGDRGRREREAVGVYDHVRIRLHPEPRGAHLFEIPGDEKEADGTE